MMLASGSRSSRGWNGRPRTSRSARDEGVLIQPMVAGGVETLIGFAEDLLF
jgi:hypothetical protein